VSVQRGLNRWRTLSPKGRLGWLAFYIVVFAKLVVGVLDLARRVSYQFGDSFSTATWGVLGILLFIIFWQMPMNHRVRTRQFLGLHSAVSVALIAWATLIYSNPTTPSAGSLLNPIYLAFTAAILWAIGRSEATGADREPGI
jgi:hypothetical protein